MRDILNQVNFQQFSFPIGKLLLLHKRNAKNEHFFYSIVKGIA